MNKIDNIVYLMLENRSLDSVLGWLYEHDRPRKFINCGVRPRFGGLTEGIQYNPKPNGGNEYASKIPTSAGQMIPSVDPHEKFKHVNDQIFYKDTTLKMPSMMGFYSDFSTQKGSTPAQIMQSFTPESLPMLNFLAKQFAVSDKYFASIPSQTDCNRAFSVTGNSIGHEFGTWSGKKAFVDNVPLYEGTYRYYLGKTLWNVLDDAGIKGTDEWMVYYSDKWRTPGFHQYCFTQDLFWDNLRDFKDHFKYISEFKTRAREGNLPKFSYLEPAWTIIEDGIGLHGNDYHPPGNVAPGEHFLKEIYEVIFNSPKNKNTLLIINFDEHGGIFDHIPPPFKALSPWENPNDGTSFPGSSEFDFKFDRLGVRVPLILVSPFVEQSTLFRAKDNGAFDHTSVIASILEFFGLTDRSKWQLGSRVRNAPSFLEVVTRSEARSMPAPPKLPPIPKSVQQGKIPANDLQRTIVHRMLHHYARQADLDTAKFSELYNQNLDGVETVEELVSAANRILGVLTS